MKIGVMADSHENMEMIGRAVRIFNAEGVVRVLHAGDIISPITSKEFRVLKAPFTGVFGNNDGERFYLREKFAEFGGRLHEGFAEIETGGRRILLMHEPRQIESLASSGDYDIIVYGHTHDIDERRIGKTLIINPGETGGWLRGRATIAIIDLEPGEPTVEIRDLGTQGAA